ncbi:accelerated cell death 1, partial [Tribonema minus]
VELLGEPLVLWQDSTKQWRAALDRCPHRWAPLSEGFVDPEQKRLTCAYHGWEFEGDGRGARIQQAEGTAEETALRSRR